MKALVLFILLMAFRAGAEIEHGQGEFERFALKRPKLSWELLPGYRLFFHPEHRDPLRRALNLAVPTERKVRAAWSLVRPAGLSATAGAWLRVEGRREQDRIAFEWDGRYRDAEFPDQSYQYEVHVRWEDGESLDQTVWAVKSKDHPRFVRLAGVEVGDNPQAFKAGGYEPEAVAAEWPLARSPKVDLEARVYAPALAEPFFPEGVQVSFRQLEDAEGRLPLGTREWSCACRQPLPLDSPARKQPRRVRCTWQVEGLQPGLYELSLGLYHKMRQDISSDPCDAPILDEDRVRVRLLP